MDINGEQANRSPDRARRARINRAFALAALVFVALGVLFDQFFVTWLNATLL